MNSIDRAVQGIRGMTRFDWYSALIAAPFAILLYWLVTSATDRAPPVVYREAHAVEKSVPAGGQIDIRFDVERFRICQVLNVYRYVTDRDGLEHSVSSYTVSAETRPGRERYDRTITVPETVEPGPSSYFIRIKYACSFMHNLGWPIVVESPRARFMVTPSATEGLNVPPLPERPQPPT